MASASWTKVPPAVPCDSVAPLCCSGSSSTVPVVKFREFDVLLSVLIGIAVIVVAGGVVVGCLVLARVRAARRYARRRRAAMQAPPAVPSPTAPSAAAPSAAALENVDVTNDDVEALLEAESLIVRSRLAGETDVRAYHERMRELALASQDVPPKIVPR